jgi:hypothetical protein
VCLLHGSRFCSLPTICKCNGINGGFSLSLSLYAGDEEWDDGNEQNVLEAAEQDNGTTAIKRECYLLDCQSSRRLFFSIYVQQVAAFA